MITVTTINDTTFGINGLPYQKGSAFITQYGNKVSLSEIGHNSKNYVDRVDFSEYRDGASQPFADVETLITYLGQTIML